MTRVSTAYLLTCAVIGVAGALLLAPANWLSTALFVGLPFASQALAGLWLLPAVIALRLLQRPGAGLMVGLISGLVLAPFSGYGLTSVYTNLWWAFFAELGFLILIYRRWNLWQHYLGAVVVGLLHPWLSWEFLNLGSFEPILQVAFFAISVISCVAGTALGISIAAGLRRAGVGATVRPRAAAVPDAVQESAA